MSTRGNGVAAVMETVGETEGGRTTVGTSVRTAAVSVGEGTGVAVGRGRLEGVTVGGTRGFAAGEGVAVEATRVGGEVDCVGVGERVTEGAVATVG